MSYEQSYSVCYAAAFLFVLQLVTTNYFEGFAGSPDRTEPSESGKAGLYQPRAGDAPPGGWADF